MNVLFTIAITLAAGLLAAALRHALTRPRRRTTNTWLFSQDATQISLRSADNLRLLNDDQLRDYETD